MASLDIKLKRPNKTYQPGENIKGNIAISSKGDLSHNGITLFVEGNVNLHLSAKSVGMFEAFYNSVKPIQLINYSVELAGPGKLYQNAVEKVKVVTLRDSGTFYKLEFPFEVPLEPKGNKKLFDTYHGVFVNIQYSIRCEIKRSMLTKDMVKQLEFVVEQSHDTTDRKQTVVNFEVTPNTLENVKEKVLPNFKLTGRLDTICCNITEPFTGELIVENSASLIKSIELQLVRVETCGYGNIVIGLVVLKVTQETIGEGNVCHNVPIPIYMIFPRLFTCPTLITNNFKVEFEVNIVMTFNDDHQITENFPIQLFRA
ncbi:Down syndrome critical region protein 3 [Trichoplax sp. H2]|nr:Down syndrome critical region protein 3 [Trichoplax sp. H2]|eukprot:RDD36722.1 Down syndrome critical region protein 3 [Trichoplax sp. H2]